MASAGGRDVRQLLLQVDASVELARRNINSLAAGLQRDSAKMQGSLERVDRSSEMLGRAFGQLKNAAIGVFAGLQVTEAGQQFLRLADEAKNLEAQLRLATAQTGNFAKATEDVRRIAEATRSGLSDTAQLYGNFIRNGRELGLTQAEAARATETFSKTLTISGAGAAEAGASIRQFSQALASGVLRGDEFNSIMENAPRLARLLADSLDVPVGSLRAMAEAGQLTADKLTRALTDARVTDGIDGEFRQLPVTFDQAMVQVHNAAVITFGAFDRGGEFSNAIANFVTGTSSGFAEIEASAERLGIEIRSTFAGLGDVFLPLYEGAMAVFGGIDRRVNSSRDAVASLLGSVDTLTNLPNAFADSLVAGGVTTRGGIADRFIRPDKNWRPTNLRERFESGYDAASRDRTAAAADRRLNDRYGGAPFQRFMNEPDRYDLFGNARDKKAPSITTSGGGAARKAKARSPRKTRTQDLATPAQQREDELIEDLEASIYRRLGFAEEIREVVAPNGDRSFETFIAGLEPALEKSLELQATLDKVAETSKNFDIIDADELARLEQFNDSFNRDLTDGLAAAVVYGDDLGDVLVNSLKRAAAEAIGSGLLDLLSGGRQGTSFGSFFGNIGRAFGGFREQGGPVSPGKAYVVGEKRAELFIPKVPGFIAPSVGGGAGGRLHLEIAPSPLFTAQIRQSHDQAVTTSVSYTNSALRSATRPRLSTGG